MEGGSERKLDPPEIRFRIEIPRNRGRKSKMVLRTLDGIPGVVPGLVPGFQGCKSPGSLGKTWDQAKSLKFILIDSNFLLSPVLRPPVTLGVSRSLFEEFFFFQKGLFQRTPSRDSQGYWRCGSKRPSSCLARTVPHMSKT